MSYKSNRRQFDSLKQQAFHNTADRFGDALNSAMDAYIYEWDNITYRKSGEVAGSPRDIVDTGEMRNTRYDVSKINQRDYIYPADHAVEAWDEHRTSEGDDFITVAVESEDWTRVYREEWQKLTS